MANFKEDIAVCFIFKEVLVLAHIYMFHRPVNLDLRLKLLRLNKNEEKRRVGRLDNYLQTKCRASDAFTRSITTQNDLPFDGHDS